HRAELDDDLPTVNVGSPLVAAVTLLTVCIMIGATLGVVMAYLVTGLVSALLWGLALAVASVALAVGVVVYRARRS
ncbi:MAG: hypothetical protein ACREX8_07665, partial [Gammaproteobacteria bacterium]